MTLDPSKITLDQLAAVDAWVWADYNKIKLASGEFRIEGHEYQAGIMQSTAQKRVCRKAAQMTFSESEVLRTLHGMIYGFYPKGVLYLFPTDDDVGEFSKARFAPLIEYNPGCIGRYVRSTDSTNLKRVGRSWLYLHGARINQRVQGKKDSSKLRTRSVDKVVFDERDLMDQAAVDMALERFSHSDVQEEVDISTPTLPDYGVDKKYEEQSDQRVWMIKCRHCGGDTCLELEFPDCLQETSDGRVIRVCHKCRREIFSKDGRWIPRLSGREVEGYWIGQLNSAYVSPKKILDMFRDPDTNLQEFYNSKMGMAYVAAENKLTLADVYACCGKEPVKLSHQGPCAMGVDVGKLLNVVVGCRPAEKKTRVLCIARVSSFNDVHDIAQKFNVKVAVVDVEPELRAARAFADAEPYGVWLCDYNDNLLTEPKWDDKQKLLQVNRTSVCDSSHNLVRGGMFEIPRRNEEVEVFAKQVSSPAKVLEEDEKTGSRRYTYRKTGGDDHYRHALNYFWLASGRIGIAEDDTPEARLMKMLRERQINESYNPLRYGLGLR